MNRNPEDVEALSPLKRALLALKDMQARLDAVERAQHEPIAIIGMGCRFPNGADNPEAFWRMLRDGVDGISEVPPVRWDVDAYYDPNPAAPGKMSTRWGGFVNQVDQFDAAFFGISTREALWMDPQQRLMLEVAWEALEDAGQTAGRWTAAPAGVFIGISSSDYVWHQVSDPTDVDAYTSTGNSYSIVANRLSYLLDLKGPSLAVDTACSSSLVAVHLACQSLRNQECHLALAGGVNLMLSPIGSITLSKYGMMAVDGHCKTFDAAADGFVRGEGCGVVVLKRLSGALAAGDPILALIRGSAVNQDGRSNGLTAPNVLSQQEVILQALAQAEVAPGDLQYVEAHGTGTALGDPIEIEALSAVLGRRSEGPEGPGCAVGSVKANIGHLEAAAGIAGLIKVVLALQHEAIPPQPHFHTLNPHIDLAKTPLRIAPAGRLWPKQERPRVAGVSAFGFGGTNAHAVLEEAPARAFVQARARTCLLPLSARSPKALAALAQSYQEFLDGEPSLHDVCYTASLRRNHHTQRAAVVGNSPAEIAGRLKDAASFEPAGAAPALGTVFVFGGQGEQWAGMGRELLAQEPVFKQAIDECEALLRHYVRWSLTEELIAEEPRSRLSQTEIAQPALMAFQVGLAALWRSWGIEPAAVVGHSIGEVAAAHVAGALSLADAVRVAVHRGSLMERAHGQGAMLAVELTPEEALLAVDGFASSAGIAAVNSPTATVLSGDPAALVAIARALQRRGVAFRELKAPYAFHSSQLAPMQGELEQALRGMRPRPATLPIVSTLTGQQCGGGEFDAGYWGRQLREPVRFADAVTGLAQKGHRVFLELSPHPVLGRSVSECHEDAVALCSLRRNRGECEVMLSSLGRLYTLGYSVAWSQLYPEGGQCVPLPPYPWQHERFWPEKRRAHRGVSPRHAHPLLGYYLQPAADSAMHCWQSEIGRESVPYLNDHRVQGAMLLPAAAYVEIALAASAEALGEGPHAIQQIAFTRAMFLPEDRPQTIQCVIQEAGPQGSDRSSPSSLAAEFQLFSRQSNAWLLNATGAIVPGSAASAHNFPEQARARCLEEISAAAYYEAMRGQGLEYGPSFQGVQQIWRRDGEAIGRLQVSEPAASSYQINLALLDACFQVLGAAIPKEDARRLAGNLYLPVGIGRVQIYSRPHSELWAHAVFRVSGEVLTGDVFLLDERGQAILEVHGLHLQRLGADPPAETARWLYEVQWQPKTRPEVVTQRDGHWLIVTDHDGIGESLAQLLLESGAQGTLVPPGAVAISDQSYQHVVHVCGADSPQHLRSALELVQQLAKAALPQPPRLWLVTRGAQFVAAAPRPIAVDQTTLSGLARVIANEHPELWGGIIDLDSQMEPYAAARSLFGEIAHSGGEDQIAFRDGRRYVARLVRHEPIATEAEALRLRDDVTYLITGGLGGLGLRVAQWMVERGARHLLLIGRRPASDFAAEAIRHFEQTGARVTIAQADVSSAGQLAAALSTIDPGFPLGGIVHAAGVLDDGLLLQQDWDRFTRVMAPKVQGAWNLHNLTLDRSLDFFVMFSSMTSLVGSPGQANYAAANAFLDGFAAWRSAQGLPALSINWGPWAEVGMAAAQPHMEERMKLAGMRAIAPAAGLEVLEQLMAQPLTQVGVMDVNWRQFQPGAAPPPLLADLIRTESARVQPHSQFRETLRRARSEERQSLLENHLRQQLAKVIGAAPSAVDVEQPLSNLGIDSLMAIELRTKIQSDLGVVVPIAQVLQGPTVRQMTALLLEQLTTQWLAEAPRRKDTESSDGEEWEVLTI